LESKKGKMLEIIQKTKEDIVERGREIEQAEKEKIRLQRILEKQEISAADVEKMNIQKEKLERSLRTFTEQKEALTKIVWEREMVVAKKLQIVRHLSTPQQNKKTKCLTNNSFSFTCRLSRRSKSTTLTPRSSS
jgi:SMC interacting uncharacterized protein involved in chromosome segregation